MFDQEQVIGFQMSLSSGILSLKRWKFVWWVCGLPKKERRMSASSTEKLPPHHSRFATTRFILLMPSKGTRKTKIAKRGFWSHIRNEFEVSPQFFWAECSTQWPSAQCLRSNIQPNYQIVQVCIQLHLARAGLLFGERATTQP